MKARFYDRDPRWVDGTTRYGRLLREHVPPAGRVLDIGAGGAGAFSHVAHLSGRRIVGIDPDPAVRRNPMLARAVVGRVEQMPFPDGTFDAVVCNYVLEHIQFPLRAAAEIYRVTAPGGAFVFRTPNLWHYAAMVSRLVPPRLHGRAAVWAKDKEGPPDVFPTTYRCNTLEAVRRTFCRAGFRPIVLDTLESEPSYMQFSAVGFALGLMYERLVNCHRLFAPFRANIVGVLRKPASPARTRHRKASNGSENARPVA
jgi:SAM-dependent methyltransferase